MFYASRHRRLDEAQMLIERAIELEPSQLIHRLNFSECWRSNGIMRMRSGVLQDAMRRGQNAD